MASITYVLIYTVALLWQVIDGFDIGQILSTETVLTSILAYYAFLVFPRTIWPFIKEQRKAKQKADLNKEMVALATQERNIEMLAEVFEHLVRVQEELIALLKELSKERKPKE